MNVIVTPGVLRGAVRVPPSKSAAHRALIAAALADAPTRVRLGAMNRDIEATLNCLRALGAGVEADGDVLRVSPVDRRGVQREQGTGNREQEWPGAPRSGGVHAATVSPVPCTGEPCPPPSPKAFPSGEGGRAQRGRKRSFTIRFAPLSQQTSSTQRQGTSSVICSANATFPRGEGSDTPSSPVACVPEEVLLDCGESGSTLRFMLPVAAALGAKARVVGHGRLPQRPNAPLTDALRAHGAAIDGDLLPMNLSGNLRGGLWTLPGNVSSQYVTGLLFALPLLGEDSEIALTTPLESAAYVNMTLQTLAQFGVEVTSTPTGWVVPGGQRYRSPGEIDVEGDWSAAAFWLAANALGAEIELSGLRDDTAQGDRAALWLVGKPEIDASNVPDLVPALAVAAAGRPGRTVVTGAARLRLKESDRLESVAKLLAALGHRAEVTADGLIIEGGLPEPAGAAVRTADGANDHRVVMAAAVAAAFADAPVRITNAEAVAKSYPDFFRDFNALGGHAYVEPAGQ